QSECFLFCPNCFITILTGKMDGMMQRLPQRRELSPKVTEGVAAIFLFRAAVSIDTKKLRFNIQCLCFAYQSYHGKA
ncbi:MAG: hypothetical protein SPE35_01485, partial [Butyricicoccus sp.]|nr:hypothetical protein [Butyricicoccus sp.]